MNTYIYFKYLFWENFFLDYFYWLMEMMLTYKSATKLQIPMKKENKKGKEKERRKGEVKRRGGKWEGQEKEEKEI